MSERVTAGPTELSWDPNSRTATLRFVEPGEGGLTEAERLIEHLQGWIGETSAGPFHLLVDCSSMVDVDAGWRMAWAEFFKHQRERALVAWFNANARIRLIILMFRKGTGVTGEAFATEEEARAWLTAQAGGG